MPPPQAHQVTFRRALREWWQDRRARHGALSAGVDLLRQFWDFLRDSTPERRRRRFGDADFDWERRVNTTGGTVSWRDRLIGAFTSGYQATEPALFHEMLRSLPVDFHDFTFVDLGSGKGRALVLAADYPFRRIVGVELLPDLDRIAGENLRAYRAATQRCFALESICTDAQQFEFPEQPLLIYIFNPFLETVLGQVIANLERSVAAHPRPVCVLYHNPILADVVTRGGIFTRIGGTHQFSAFANREACRRMQGPR